MEIIRRIFKKKKLLILFFCFDLILTIIQLCAIKICLGNLPIFIIILNIIYFFIYMISEIYFIFILTSLEITSTNLDTTCLYNKTLEKSQDNTKAFKHDFTNILLGMTGYIEDNDINGLKKYHNQLLDDIKLSNSLLTLSPETINNPAIYNILATKYHKADNLGIKINLDIFIDLNSLNMKIYEFSRILGILMDNAIEACNECDDKVINVTIRNDKRKNMQLLLIENTYKDKDINIDKIFEKSYSTKQGNTGLGLWEIRKILKKNNNLNLYTTKNNKYFSQQLEIYC